MAVVQYTFTRKQYIEQHTNSGRVRAVPHLCGFYPGICLTTEEKAQKTLSQGGRRVPAGMMRIHKHTIRIHRHNNKNTQITVLNRNTAVHTLIKTEPDEHTSSNFILSVCLPIMLDILLLRPSIHCNTSLHFTTLHATTLRYTYRHFTPSHLLFTTLSCGLTHLHSL